MKEEQINNNNQEVEYKRITCEEAKKMMDADPKLIILDVRREEEYVMGHVPKAVLIPNESITLSDPIKLQNDLPILVYCKSGVRSRQAAIKLMAKGYNNIYDFGGIEDWKYEIEYIK